LSFLQGRLHHVEDILHHPEEAEVVIVDEDIHLEVIMVEEVIEDAALPDGVVRIQGLQIARRGPILPLDQGAQERKEEVDPDLGAVAIHVVQAEAKGKSSVFSLPFGSHSPLCHLRGQNLVLQRKTSQKHLQLVHRLRKRKLLVILQRQQLLISRNEIRGPGLAATAEVVPEVAGVVDQATAVEVGVDLVPHVLGRGADHAREVHLLLLHAYYLWKGLPEM